MMQQLRASSYLFGGNAPFVEQLYEQWLENPQGVPAQWRDYFERLQLLPSPAGAGEHLHTVEILAPLLGHRARVDEVLLVELLDERRVAAEQVRVLQELLHHGLGLRCRESAGEDLDRPARGEFHREAMGATSRRCAPL